MAEWLIDTAIIVDLMRGYTPALKWQTNNKIIRVGISPLVWMEVIEGEENKIKQLRTARVLRELEMIYMTREDQEWAMKQHLQFYLSHNARFEDCLIAAPAARLQIPLYTRNLKHFAPLLGALAQKPY